MTSKFPKQKNPPSLINQPKLQPTRFTLNDITTTHLIQSKLTQTKTCSVHYKLTHTTTYLFNYKVDQITIHPIYYIMTQTITYLIQYKMTQYNYNLPDSL